MILLLASRYPIFVDIWSTTQSNMLSKLLIPTFRTNYKDEEVDPVCYSVFVKPRLHVVLHTK